MATTTTWPAIRNVFTNALKDATPTIAPNVPFDECPQEFLLLPWALGGGECTRRFQWGSRNWSENARTDPDAYEREDRGSLVFAYPALPGLYDRADPSGAVTIVHGFNRLEDWIQSDGAQVRDTLQSPGNFVAGQSDMTVTRVDIARTEPVWFVTYDVRVKYTRDQTLT